MRDGLLSRIVSLGKPLSVIAETRDGRKYTAHSDTFIEVRFDSPSDFLHGEMLFVRPVSHKDGIVYAEII